MKDLSPFDIIVLKRSVATLWDAVQRGIYDARSIVGDETLHMKEALFGEGYDELEIELNKLKERRKS